jgi:hypothetical protein
MLRGKALKWLSGACCACALLCVKGCVLTFDDYPEGDLCAASNDAGIHPSTAPDPALRGCDAGAPAPEPDAGEEDSGKELAGASGMGGAR